MATEQLIWIDPDSTQWVLSGSAGRVLEEIQNAGPIEHQHFTQTFPLLAGNFRVGGRDQARIINMQIMHVACTDTADRDQYFEDRDSLSALFDPTRGQSTLRWQRTDGTQLDILGYAWARPELTSSGGMGSVGLPITLSFYAPWGYWFNDSETQTDTITLSGTSTQTTTLNNGTAANGYVASYPHSFTITGQATNVDIWITGQNSSINFNSSAGYTISSGETATVYGPPSSQPRVLLNGSTRIDGYLVKDDTTFAFRIPLGSSTLNAKGGAAGDDGVVTVKFRKYRRGV